MFMQCKCSDETSEHLTDRRFLKNAERQSSSIIIEPHMLDDDDDDDDEDEPLLDTNSISKIIIPD